MSAIDGHDDLDDMTDADDLREIARALCADVRRLRCLTIQWAETARLLAIEGHKRATEKAADRVIALLEAEQQKEGA